MTLTFRTGTFKGRGRDPRTKVARRWKIAVFSSKDTAETVQSAASSTMPAYPRRAIPQKTMKSLGTRGAQGGGIGGEVEVGAPDWDAGGE
mmetsp:Transcript_17858/g.31983  ORF Transcript_17858/g.31983 Transcript_17858/m.31983 type:complete len:90 (+) Transcript_17858:52-321(+)